MKLKDKIAVITGGSSGIGLATAQLFIEQGARVVITGRNQERLDQALDALGEKALAVKGDASSITDLDVLFETVKDRFGKVDVLFLNAGVAQMVPLEATTEGIYDNMMDINVKGPFFAIQKASPLLSEGASIILNSSVAALRGITNFSVYSASKAALNAMVRGLAAELGPRGIRVNTLSPGPIATPLWGKMGVEVEALDEMSKGFAEKTVLSRVGQPEEIAAVALFLGSAESSFVTGIDLVADGGMSFTF